MTCHRQLTTQHLQKYHSTYFNFDSQLSIDMKPLQTLTVLSAVRVGLSRIPASQTTLDPPKRRSSNVPSPSAKEKLQTDPSASSKEERSMPQAPRKKTMTELDEEMKLKMEGISGDGGASGVEYENGKAEGLKRNVKSNMFRVI